MDKLKIIRPNGEEEIAELTTDKSLVGNNYLKLDIGGVPHYAKVGDVVDTHMYTFTGVDGKKYYIKKEIGNAANETFVEFTSDGEFISNSNASILKLSDGIKDVYVKIMQGGSFSVNFIWLHAGIDYRWVFESDDSGEKAYGQTALRNKYLKISWSDEINQHDYDYDLSE